MKTFFQQGLWIALIPLVVFTISIVAVKKSDSPTVTVVKGSSMPGYQVTPDVYHVEASPAKRWNDTTPTVMIIAGFILAMSSGIYVVLMNESVRQPSVLIVALLWLLGAVLIFGKYVSTYGDSSYDANLCTKVYEEQKTNLDGLFPFTQKEELNCQ